MWSSASEQDGPRSAPSERRHDAPDTVGLPLAGSPYVELDRPHWAGLAQSTPLPLTEEDVRRLQGLGERVDLREVQEVYLPLSRLLNLYVSATQDLARVSSTFLGSMAPRVPYIIGVAGSVAVGKSTFARILQALLARWPDHPSVGLVTTVSGWFGVIAVTTVFRAIVPRSASNVWKLCTGRPSGLNFVVCFCTAVGERCAGATTLVRKASAVCLSASSNSIGARP